MGHTAQHQKQVAENNGHGVNAGKQEARRTHAQGQRGQQIEEEAMTGGHIHSQIGKGQSQAHMVS